MSDESRDGGREDRTAGRRGGRPPREERDDGEPRSSLRRAGFERGPAEAPDDDPWARARREVRSRSDAPARPERPAPERKPPERPEPRRERPAPAHPRSTPADARELSPWDKARAESMRRDETRSEAPARRDAPDTGGFAPRRRKPRSTPGGGRPAGPPRSGPPRSGPPRSGPPRSGPPRSGPPRSGPPRSGPPRSGPPRPPRPPRVEAPPKPTPLDDVETLDLRIEQIVFGGDGLGRVDGFPVFVPRTAVGDRVRVEIEQRKPGFGRARVIELLEPGAGRREPPCRHFERCGGCDLQHLDDATQLQVKVQAVRETLRRIGGIDAPPRVEVVAGPPLGYRLRTQLHVADTDRGREVGYFARGSRDLVPITECPILVPELEAMLRTLPRRLRDAPHERIDLAAGDDAITTAPPTDGLPTGDVATRVGDLDYVYDARCFFQGNRLLLSELVEHAMGEAEPGEDAEVAYDLYAGVGLFALPLAQRYARVVAVEGDRIAVRYGRKNARRNGLDSVHFENRSLEAWVAELPPNAARVLLDPPRSGLSSPVRRALRSQRPRRVTYVSCQAPTLARDLKILLRETYDLESLTLLDLFPQTGHMEVIAQLRLRDDDAGDRTPKDSTQSPEAGAEGPGRESPWA